MKRYEHECRIHNQNLLYLSQEPKLDINYNETILITMYNKLFLSGNLKLSIHIIFIPLDFRTKSMIRILEKPGVM